MLESATAELAPIPPSVKDPQDPSERNRLFLREHRKRLHELLQDPKMFFYLHELGKKKKEEGRRLTIDETIACVGYRYYEASVSKKSAGAKDVQGEGTPSAETLTQTRQAIVEEFFDLMERVLERDWPKERMSMNRRTKEEVKKGIQAYRKQAEVTASQRTRKCLPILKTARDWLNKFISFKGFKQISEMQAAEKDMGNSGDLGGREDYSVGVDALLKELGLE